MVERRAWVLTVTARHWVITWVDGGLRQLLRKVTRFELPEDQSLVRLNGVDLPWKLETSLSATSRADFIAKARALSRNVGRPAEWLSLPQLGLQRRMLVHCTSTSAATYKDLTVNGINIAWPSAAASVFLEGFNANDTAAGSGLRSATITGLDANWNEVSETLTTNGIGNGPNSTTLFRRINGGVATSTGTDIGGNNNSVYVKDGAGNRHFWFGNVYEASSSAGYGVGVAKGPNYTIPAGYTGYVTRIGLSSTSGSSSVAYFLWGHSNATATEPAVVLWRQTGDFPSTPYKDLTVPIKVPEKTDLWFSAISGSSNVYGHATIFLVAN